MKEITYEALINVRRQQMESTGLASKTIANAVSYLRRYLMVPYGRSENDPVGAELGDDFLSFLDRATAVASSNRRAVQASLKQWRDCHLSLLRTQDLPPTFHEALVSLFHRNGLVNANGTYKTAVVAKCVGSTQGCISAWVNGRGFPSPKSRDVLPALEEYFDLPKNALISLLPGCLDPKAARKKPKNKHPIPENFTLTVSELTATARRELETVVQFKTAPAPPPGMDRNKRWRIRSYDEWGGARFPLACLQNGYCSAAAKSTETILRYYGFLHREKSVPIENISLAYIASSDLVYAYLIFLVDRSAGAFTASLSLVIAEFSALLHPEWGFIPQTPDLSHRHPAKVSRDQWNEYCTQERQRMTKMMKDLRRGNNLVPGRNPEDLIADILREEHPMDTLLLLDERMGADRPPATQRRRYRIWMRNRLLIRMLITNPLRINHYKTMTFRPDNTGNLRQDKMGFWWLVFEPRHFKNHQGTAKRRYEARVSSWAAELLDEYLQDVRPHLFGAEESDYLFLRTSASRGDRFQVVGIDQTIRAITRRYLSDIAPDGFGPHAFRHIVATALLKDGHSIDTVAAALHDSPEMIRKQYGHLSAADGIGALSNHVDDLLKLRDP